MRVKPSILSVLTLPLALSAQAGYPSPEQLQPGIRKVSFVLTNDVHGHIEPSKLKNGRSIGGLSYLAGYLSHLRAQTEYYNQQTPLFVLDSGDQFQGTLLSNNDEGKAVFQAFNEIGYDAIIPGNHDYDFGPIGWLYDVVTPGKTSENPWEVIEGLAKTARFPLLSANTYLKATIKTPAGVTLDASCEAGKQTLREPLDFSKAERPSFLRPYVISEKAGIRVALVGIDNKHTASTTMAENVGNICFRDEVETYLDIRRELEGKADIFVILMHNGDTSNTRDGSEIAKAINAAIPGGVDLVAAGHTHFVHDNTVDGVHVIQDGAEAKAFGRVDLFFDLSTRKVIKERTLSWAGQDLVADECKRGKNDRNAFVCDDYPVPLVPHPRVEALIQSRRKEIGPLANRRIFAASEAITRDRTDESALTNLLTDSLRAATGAEIALMNTGGIRKNLDAGEISYESFFEVLPFNNQTAVINAVPWELLRKLLLKSAQTCGRYGALLFSGLRVEYSRTCVPGKDIDAKARLVRIETTEGELLYDADKGLNLAEGRTFKVATMDFIATGGSGFEDFRGTKIDSSPGITRELIADQLAARTDTLTNAVDGRFKNIAPPVAPTGRANLKLKLK